MSRASRSRSSLAASLATVSRASDSSRVSSKWLRSPIMARPSSTVGSRLMRKAPMSHVAGEAGDRVGHAGHREHHQGGALPGNHQAGDGRHVDPERGRARAPVKDAGGQRQREQGGQPGRRAPGGGVPVGERDHEDDAERRDDRQPARDVERVVIVAEQAGYRLDEVDEPDRGEGHPPHPRAPRHRAGGAPRVAVGCRQVVDTGSGHGQIASAAFLTANVASPTKAASQIRMMLTGIHETEPLRVTSVASCTIR